MVRLSFFFFFSSRRRHTRCSRDWSSDVCSSDPPRVALGEPGDRAELVGLQLTVRDPDADHEVACRLSLTALAADRADAVALGVDTPPAKVRSEPLRGNRVPALAREALDFGVRLPGVQLALEPLDTLGLRLGPGHRASKYLLSIGFVKSPLSPAACPSGAPRDTFPALPFLAVFGGRVADGEERLRRGVRPFDEGPGGLLGAGGGGHPLGEIGRAHV